MAEPLHYRPEQAKRLRPETLDELERFEGRIGEINALLDQLYESGLVRWLKDLLGAMPEVSTIALGSLNTDEGRAGLRNLLVLGQQLGKIDPDQLEHLFDALHAGARRAGETERGEHGSAYDPPGVTGVFKLLRDEELWHTLAPVIEGAKAYSAARAKTPARNTAKSESRNGDDEGASNDA